MTTFDLKPLFHSTIGFDRLVDMFNHSAHHAQPKPASYPPYNIEKSGEDHYEIVMAVAGFKKEHLTITLHDNHLTVEAKNEATEGSLQKDYLHKGIAMRSFEKTFQLADFILVKDVSLAHGLLTISLKREIPEERKPRTIPISSEETTSDKDSTPSIERKGE